MRPVAGTRPRNSVSFDSQNTSKYFGIFKTPVLRRRHIHAQKTTNAEHLHVYMLIFSSFNFVELAADTTNQQATLQSLASSATFLCVPSTWEGIVLKIVL